MAKKNEDEDEDANNTYEQLNKHHGMKWIVDQSSMR